MRILLQFFLSGAVVGIGACGLHCCILLAPVVAKESRNWKEGVGAGLLFGAGKVPVYALFGGLASYSGQAVQSIASNAAFPRAGGVMLMLMGIWFFFHRGRCVKLTKIGQPLILGLLDGFAPCAVTLGLVFYIAHLGEGVVFGMLGGALFGAGTLIGPLLAVCSTTPYVWRKISGGRRSAVLLRSAGAAIFFIWGITMLMPRM